MLTLYDNSASSNALKVRILLHELGLPFEAISIALTDDRPDWFVELQPFGTVPCLVDGDLVVRESNSALRYLADREGRDDLYPSDLARRVEVDTLMDALSVNVRPFLWAAESVVIYGAPDASDWRGELAIALAAWDRMLAGPEYCTGAFSIADCAAAGRLMHLERLGLDLEPYPRTRAMLAATRRRPAYRSALA